MSLNFAVLGDSIAYGQGAARPQDTIGSRLLEDLAVAGTTAELKVLAVPRSRSDALAGQVRQALAWPAALALIVIGANDLTHFVPTEVAVGQLADAVRTLRSSGVAVVVMPAPDLSVVPWVPPQFQALVKAGSEVLRRAQIGAAQAEGALVADVDGRAGALFAGDATLFSADRFHPSSAGYAVIASALAPAVRAAPASPVDGKIAGSGAEATPGVGIPPLVAITPHFWRSLRTSGDHPAHLQHFGRFDLRSARQSGHAQFRSALTVLRSRWSGTRTIAASREEDPCPTTPHS